MNLSEMTSFLDGDLYPQIRKEVGNWIYPKKGTGGYFVVTRQIMCFVDFLGALYCGYHKSESRTDPKGSRIATTDKAVKFIISFFEPKETYQEDVVRKFHSMYRHGLVHLYQPRILDLGSKNILGWFFYRGDRSIKRIEAGGRIFRNVNHFEICTDNIDNKHSYLVISIDCLYTDFEKAIQKYRDKLINTKYLQTNWRTAVNAICKPRPESS